MNTSKNEGARKGRYRINSKRFIGVIIGFICLVIVIVLVIQNITSENVDASALQGTLSDHADDSIVKPILSENDDFLKNPTKTEKITDKDVISIPENSSSVTLSDYLIVLDPGHGGFDPGAIGINGVHEDDLNLAVAKLLEKELLASDANVIMVRENEDAIAEGKKEDMQKRREIIEQSGSDVVVSIHMNSFEQDASVSGPLVLYAPNSVHGKKLAQLVQESMSEALSVEAKSHSQDLYILKSGSQPCILVECGYLSNEEEAKRLCEEEYQLKIAKSIMKGVSSFLLGSEE